MPKKQTTVLMPVADNAKSLVIAKEGLMARMNPILTSVRTFTIRTQEDYAVADGMLNRLIVAQREWVDRVDKVLRPLNAARKEMLDLRAELSKPLESAESAIRQSMGTFRRMEQEENRRLERERLLAEDKVRQEAERKRQLASQTAAPIARARLEAAAEKLDQKADIIESTPLPEPVRVVNSGTRTILKWRVKDSMEVVKAVMDGNLSTDVLSIDEKYVNQKLRENPNLVRSWPGFEVYEDVVIVAR